MSYDPLVEIAEAMVSERWARMIEDPTFKAPPQWAANDNPRKLAAEYLRLYPWVLQLERELKATTELLEEVGDRVHGLSEMVDDQTRKSRAAIDAVPNPHNARV